MYSAADSDRFYLESETYPGVRIFAGMSEREARMRLMHAQHNDRFARYRIVKGS